MDIHEHQWAAQREELSRRIDPLISTTHDSSYHATGLPGMRCIPLTKVARCPSPALLPPLPEPDAAASTHVPLRPGHITRNVCYNSTHVSMGQAARSFSAAWRQRLGAGLLPGCLRGHSPLRAQSPTGRPRA